MTGWILIRSRGWRGGKAGCKNFSEQAQTESIQNVSGERQVVWGVDNELGVRMGL